MSRRLLGIILLILLLVLTGSGILMYFLPFKKSIASLHTLFALLFMLAMVFHIVNNKLPLKNYILGKRLSKFKKLQSPLIVLVVVLLALAVYFELPLLNKLYAFGNQIRNEQLGKKEMNFDYQVIDLKKAKGDKLISIELKKGKAFQYPLFAIWVEDTHGNYIQTLYISRVISSSTFDFGQKKDEQWKSAILRRPEALPYWSHKRGIKAVDGLYMPLGNSSDIDAYSGATPTGNFIINSKSKIAKGNYKILVELNQSYDWNEYYTKDKYPNDKIYSGSGQVGQPSLIYEVQISSNDFDSNAYKLMTLVGHGHYSGKDGELYKNLNQVTSAKQIADRIIIHLKSL
ncbi:hypothetical protein [Hwangdonia lutea]|uniref:Flavinylation-associated cytochrome domain-containing protein n=1 Tax=Hwangdonia lutea TaxID=3075823 RepID=A0AA97HR81_9FLAO|nr:hypothetical protein [Hwangdonia sp. SCSIO 19198]WOD43543.1 hypothetical protein RNZ46_16260 [Hwangdonia sp. SCSIO 19198]